MVIKASSDQFSIDALLPLMQRRSVDANDVLFNANDPAEALYYVLEGTLHLPELDKEMGPGSILGEVGIFSDTGRRTASAVAKTDCIVMSLTKAAVLFGPRSPPTTWHPFAQNGDGANVGECPHAQPLVAAAKDLAKSTCERCSPSASAR